MRKYRKNTKSIFLIGLVSFISIGYAYITSNLDIKGTTKIGNAKWDVAFNSATINVTNISNSVDVLNGELNNNKPIVNVNNNQELEYEVRLNSIGDVYEFTIDIANNGDIDAELKSIESKIKINNGNEVNLTSSNLPSYLDYSVTYSDNDTIDVSDRLYASDSKTIKVHVGLKSNLTNDQFLQALGQTIKFKYILNYVQADVGA